MKALKTMTVVGLILSASAFGVRASDGATTLSINEQIRAAIAMFQDQKADFLKKQRDEQKSSKDKARDEIRDQVVAVQASAIRPLVRELRQSIEEAKRQAVEQNRKLLQEAAEAARTRRSN